MVQKEWDWADLKKRMQNNNVVVPIVDRINKNNEKRGLLANAILEDEVVRLASEANSTLYLQKKDAEDRVPFWMWCLLYFILGGLFMITFDSVFYSIVK